jgi:hypothetical protein
MVLTWSEAKGAYAHILENVLGRGDGTPPKNALDEEGINNIFQLINLDLPTINNLQYHDSSSKNAVTNVKTGDKMLLKSFLDYIATRQNEGNYPS